MTQDEDMTATNPAEVTSTQNEDGTWTRTTVLQVCTGRESNLVDGEWVTTRTFDTETVVELMQECGECFESSKTMFGCSCGLSDEDHAAREAEWSRLVD